MYIDVHCHLNEEDYGSISALIEECQSLGVNKIISVGYDLESSYRSQEYAKKYPSVYFSAGFHPTEVGHYCEGDLYRIEELLKDERCVSLGEIGLDYHYDDTDERKQKRIFIEQLELAKASHMPVQIHSRDCALDMQTILVEHQEKWKESGAMLHCYSHSVEVATELEKLGLYFSFGGTSTFKGSKKAQRTIARLQQSRLLTETDSPYLAPKSIQGTFPNTPKSIPEILENMATLQQKSVEQMAEIVWQNAHTFFPKLK